MHTGSQAVNTCSCHLQASHSRYFSTAEARDDPVTDFVAVCKQSPALSCPVPSRIGLTHICSAHLELGPGIQVDAIARQLLQNSASQPEEGTSSGHSRLFDRCKPCIGDPCARYTNLESTCRHSRLPTLSAQVPLPLRRDRNSPPHPKFAWTWMLSDIFRYPQLTRPSGRCLDL